MAYTFEIHGEVATDVTTDARGYLRLFLENRSGFQRFTIPPTGEVGAEVRALFPGDRIALEAERDGWRLTIHAVRVTYIRGFPHIR
jgi:hypothetical protein